MVARYKKLRPPSTVRANCEMTVSWSEGTACIWPARKVMARNRLPRMPDIHIRVMPALWLRGSLKAVMPFEMASMPVSAAVPLEKACRIRNRPTTDTAAVPAVMGGGLGTSPRLPVR